MYKLTQMKTAEVWNFLAPLATSQSSANQASPVALIYFFQKANKQTKREQRIKQTNKQLHNSNKKTFGFSSQSTALLLFTITKTRLFKYVENFTSKN